MFFENLWPIYFLFSGFKFDFVFKFKGFFEDILVLDEISLSDGSTPKRLPPNSLSLFVAKLGCVCSPLQSS